MTVEDRLSTLPETVLSVLLSESIALWASAKASSMPLTLSSTAFSSIRLLKGAK